MSYNWRVVRFFIYSFLISLFCVTVVISADYYVLGAAGSGSEFLTVNEHGLCKDLENTTGNVIFIPTRSHAEWNSFVSTPPPGVTIYNCCAKVC